MAVALERVGEKGVLDCAVLVADDDVGLVVRALAS